MWPQIQLSLLAFAVAATSVAVFHANRMVLAGEGIKIANSDGATCGADDQAGSETPESSIISEYKASRGDVLQEELDRPPQTRPGGTGRTLRLDVTTAEKILEEWPPPEELRKALAEKYDLSKAGGERPNTIATAIIKGWLEGDEEKVVTAYDLSTKEGILVAMTQVTAVRLVKLRGQLYATVETKFGEDGLKVLNELEESDVQDRQLQSPRYKTNVPVDEALASMEVYYTEDGQKAIVKLPGGEPIEMHQRNGRWYASASPEDAAKSAIMYSWISLPVAAFERQIEIVEKAESLEQLRQELKTEKETPLLDAIEAEKGSGDGADAGDNTFILPTQTLT